MTGVVELSVLQGHAEGLGLEDGKSATFLFTDIEGSTQKWQRFRDAMPGVLARHDDITMGCLARYGGSLIKHTGDGIFAAFDGGEPLHAALDMQRRFRAESWGEIGELRVRMALHHGEAERRGSDYFGLTINRTARIMASAWGGQILITPEVVARHPLPAGASLEDLGAHTLKDLNEPQPILMLTHPDLIHEFPALRSLSARPNNLPQQSTPFIGRHNELDELRRLLEDQSCRLITIIGPGGMGKTRLGMQTAAEAIENFRHGVYFVPLAPLRSPDHLTSAVGDALKFTFQQAGDQKEQLLSYLASKEMLLVMDNFEHVISGVDLVADILQSAPNVHIISTSRERLSLQAECLYELGGLDVPASPDAMIFENFEAVELFIAYARRADPSYTLSAEDKLAVVKICRMLSGMPLGIELAAAWVRTLPPAEIAAELEADLDFLATTMRDVPERHRSMRAVFEYSWNLLGSSEQEVFAKLSVFRGGFTRDAAMLVAGARVQTLAALVDKSLVQRQMNGRYEIHELLRQYAEQKLEEVPDRAAAVQDSHASYYCTLLHNHLEALWSAAHREVARIIEDDLENVRSAWRWAIHNLRIDDIRRAYFALEIFLQVQSRYLEGAQLFEEAAAVLRRIEPGPALAEVLAMTGWFYIRLGNYEAARRDLEQSCDLYVRLDLWSESSIFTPNPLAPLSILENITGHFEEAVRAGESLLAEGVARQDTGVRLMGSYVLTGAYRAYGDLDRARQMGEQALKLVKVLNGPWFEAYCRNELATVLRAQGDYQGAKEHYEASYRIRETFDDPEGKAVARSYLGEIALLQGDYHETQRLLEQNLDIYEQIGDRGGLARTLSGLGQASRALGDFKGAYEHLRQALAISSEIRFVPLTLAIMGIIGEMLLAEGHAELAVGALRCVVRHPSSDRETRERASRILTEQGLIPDAPGTEDLQQHVDSLLHELSLLRTE